MRELKSVETPMRCSGYAGLTRLAMPAYTHRAIPTAPNEVP